MNEFSQLMAFWGPAGWVGFVIHRRRRPGWLRSACLVGFEFPCSGRCRGRGTVRMIRAPGLGTAPGVFLGAVV